MGNASRERMTGLNSEGRIKSAKDREEEKLKKEHEARVKFVKALLSTRR